MTQDRMIAAFGDRNGTHAGFRRNHAEGACATGRFESSEQAATISKAAVFKPGRVPALAGGMPFQPDAPNAVRSMALRFLAARRRGMADGHEQHSGFSGELGARLLRAVARLQPRSGDWKA